MRIMIADDHPLYVEALENLLRSDFEIVDTVTDGSQAITAAREKMPDVILMDINMPVLDGIEATRQISTEMPEIKIIILTSFEEEENLFRAIQAGAAGYLLKNLGGEDIIAALMELGKGKNPFAPGLEQCILREFQRSYRPRDEGTAHLADRLTGRQLKIIELLLQGLTYREIGETIFISERTVKYHVSKIKEVLGVHTQEQIIARARGENPFGPGRA
ncbi:MAG: response regulator transcription factor [Firmicutes bacterium]|nr:response regulator transcription factor [Bacillota bacterium]